MINKNAKNNNVLNIIKSSKIRLVFAFLFLVIAGLTLALISPKENFIKTTVRKLFSGNNPVSSVDITTDDYDEEGSIKVTKEAHWVSKNEAELNINLETIRKTGDNKKDIVLVFDVSGSMEGEKLEKVKQDASELIEYVLDKDEDNKVGLITFASQSRIISPLTNNKEELLESINNMSTEDATNYYLAYKDIETILDGYSKENGKDLVVLFMTDGVPTDGNSAQGVYESLKEQYPYMTLNAVEYEKGKTASDTVSISDNQWVANMDTFNNVLFEATVSPEVYEKLRIDDYIDDEYFEIETNTPSKGSVSIDNNKITWRFTNNSYTTGSEETLKVRLKLKEQYQNIKGLYPTNKKTEIEYKIDNSDEKTSTLTPILKNNYDVIYDMNSPETCNLEDPESENHFIYNAVTIKDIEPKCTGYTFKGWKTEETNIKYKSEDTFIMPEEDVHIKAIWSRQTMKAYMDGTVYEKTTLYKEIASQADKYNYISEYSGEHRDSLDVDGNEKIYYYSGKTSENNVLFGNYCWKVIRTTDTGGVKLIYNGDSINGTCPGTNVGIGNTSYNASSSIAYVGYMYNKTYSYTRGFPYPQTTIIQRVALNKTHYFSKYYDYNQSVTNKYRLQDNPETEEDDRFTAEECITNGNCNEILTGTYTFSSSNNQANTTTIRYVVAVSGEYVYYLELKNGQTINDVNRTLYIGDNFVKNNDGTYTVTDSSSINEFKVADWFYRYQESNNKFMCIGSNPCDNLLYPKTTTSQAYSAESVNNDYIYANDFDYTLNEETGDYEYVLKDTDVSNKIHFWDWYSNYDTLSNNHYTCFNTSGVCNKLYYIFYTSNLNYYYITLSDGENINNAVNNMLYADDVNTKDSTIKGKVDVWYSNNLSNYTDFLEDTVFCNERNISSWGGWNPNGGNNTTAMIFSNSNKLSCDNPLDRFAVNNTSAKLSYPIGLLTRYEASISNSDWLRDKASTNTGWWLLTPESIPLRSNVETSAKNYEYDNRGFVSANQIHNYAKIRPVISLRPEIEYTEGDGTVNNPYVIDTSDSDVGEGP